MYDGPQECDAGFRGNRVGLLQEKRQSWSSGWPPWPMGSPYFHLIDDPTFLCKRVGRLVAECSVAKQGALSWPENPHGFLMTLVLSSIGCLRKGGP